MNLNELLRRGRIVDAGRSLLGGHATAVSPDGGLAVTYTINGCGEASEIPLARRCALDALDVESALFDLDDGLLGQRLLLDGQAAAFRLAEETAFVRHRAHALANDPDSAYPDPNGLPDWVWEPSGTYSVRDLAPDAYAAGRRAGAAGTPVGFMDAYRERRAGEGA